ncbi:MAG TPA: lipopolysaccharide biosynthesis protein [Miltoncostaeales bacterium]|nr:lipopolysaccharide biosynthesis protein [Miltoncostaeales bacterium]
MSATRRVEASPVGQGRSLSMVLNSVTVIGGKLATMGLGFIFWVIAARTFSQDEVGLASGAVSAMMLCTQIAILGVGSALITHYPQHASDPRRLFENAFSLTTTASFAVGGATLVIAGLFLNNLSVIAHSVWFVVFFLAATVTGTLGILLDQTSIALGRGDQVLTRGLAFGLVSVGVLSAVAWGSSIDHAIGMFVPWVVAGAVAVAIGGWQLRRALNGYILRPRVAGPMWRDLTRVALPNWALTMTERTPGLVFPVIVTEVLSKRDNAVWYTAWMMAWVLFVVPISVGLTLFADATNNPTKLRRAVRVGLGTALGIGVAGGALIALLAPFLLQILGKRYAIDGVPVLRILCISVVPLAFTQAYFAICRSQRRLREALIIGAVSAVASIVVGGIAAATWGLNGIAIAWTITQTIIGLVCVQRIISIARVPMTAGGDA